MLTKASKEIGKENDWYRAGSSVFGLYKNHFFVIKEGQGNKLLIASFDEIDEKNWINLTQTLEDNQKELKFSEFGVDTKSLLLKFTEHIRHTKKEVLYTALEFLVELFEKNQIHPQNMCFDCKSQRELDYYVFDGTPAILCSQCYDTMRQEWGFVEKDFATEDKNYIQGTIGAIIYTIPGIIIWVIVALFLKAISGVLVLGLGFLAFKGFIDFGGRAGTWSKWIIAIVTIAATIVSIFATVFVGMYLNGYGYDEIFSEIWANQEALKLIKDMLVLSTIIGLIPLAYVFYEVYSVSKLPKLEAAKKVT